VVVPPNEKLALRQEILELVVLVEDPTRARSRVVGAGYLALIGHRPRWSDVASDYSSLTGSSRRMLSGARPNRGVNLNHEAPRIVPRGLIRAQSVVSRGGFEPPTN
jgi:hypothetical protein